MLSSDVEELLKLLEINKDKQVIVEGKKDKRVLCSLSFTNVITIEKGLYETTEKLSGREVLILTDFDSEGRHIAKKLDTLLQHLSYKANKNTRRKISFLFAKLRIKKIEELRGVLYG